MFFAIVVFVISRLRIFVRLRGEKLLVAKIRKTLKVTVFLVICSRRDEFSFEFHLSSYARVDVKIHKGPQCLMIRLFILWFMVASKDERNCRFGDENSHLM